MAGAPAGLVQEVRVRNPAMRCNSSRKCTNNDGLMAVPRSPANRSRVLHLAGAGLFIVALQAHAQDWLTVQGDPELPDQDTVQVDPVARELEPRVMGVRVNRSAPRISWDGVPYRSYTAQVAFDCTSRTARYRSIAFFLDPLWQGNPMRTVDYTSGPPRMMEFREIQPNPTQRIISAACPAKR